MTELTPPDPRKTFKVRHPNGQLDTTHVTGGVRELVEEFFGSAKLAICEYHLWDPKGNASKQGVPVQITAGQYWGRHGISNFWDWKEVDAKGDPIQGKAHHGYDNIPGQFHGPITLDKVREYWEAQEGKKA